MITVEKDILTVEEGIICHQVNAMGKMGAGLALKVRRKWPAIYTTYKILCENGTVSLGKILVLPAVQGRLWVANVCGQKYYGRDKRYTDYDGVRKAFTELKEWRDYLSGVAGKQIPIYFPYKMGCVNAGGDWMIYSKIIEEFFPDAVICKL